eukprot:COSAG01_NODE_1375_length_10536_cov_6.860880_4_plen_245_part_00
MLTSRSRYEPQDPKKPKRPCCAYIHFVTQQQQQRRRRQQKSSKAGNTSQPKQFSELGSKWGSMGAKRKRPYEQKAAQDKARYKRQCARYQPLPLQCILNPTPAQRRKLAKRERRPPPKSNPARQAALADARRDNASRAYTGGAYNGGAYNGGAYKGVSILEPLAREREAGGEGAPATLSPVTEEEEVVTAEEEGGNEAGSQRQRKRKQKVTQELGPTKVKRGRSAFLFFSAGISDGTFAGSRPI